MNNQACNWLYHQRPQGNLDAIILITLCVAYVANDSIYARSRERLDYQVRRERDETTQLEAFDQKTQPC